MIYLRAEGVRGNGVKDMGKKGFVQVNFTENIYDSKFIAVNGYVGSGENYREREEPKITIRNGQETFEFDSLEDLINVLKLKGVSHD